MYAKYYFIYLGNGKCLAKGRNTIGYAYSIDFDGTDISKIRLYPERRNADIVVNKINQDNRYNFKAYAFIVETIGDEWTYKLRSRVHHFTATGEAIYVYSLSIAMLAFIKGKTDESITTGWRT